MTGKSDCLALRGFAWLCVALRGFGAQDAHTGPRPDSKADATEGTLLTLDTAYRWVLVNPNKQNIPSKNLSRWVRFELSMQIDTQ